MKTYRLSSSAERIAGAAVSGILLILMAFLIFALRSDLLALIIVAAAGLLMGAVLVFYVISLFKAACTADAQGEKLHVTGLPDYTLDIARAESLETMAYQTGPVATRMLVFYDENGETVASLPTFFTVRQGAQAEPMAMELARELGLAFRPTLPVWEYDKEKRKEHEQEVAEESRKARREKLQALKAKILRKTQTGEPACASTEEETPDEGNIMEYESDGINYDALDDEK